MSIVLTRQPIPGPIFHSIVTAGTEKTKNPSLAPFRAMYNHLRTFDGIDEGATLVGQLLGVTGQAAVTLGIMAVGTPFVMTGAAGGYAEARERFAGYRELLQEMHDRQGEIIILMREDGCDPERLAEATRLFQETGAWLAKDKGARPARNLMKQFETANRHAAPQAGPETLYAMSAYRRVESNRSADNIERKASPLAPVAMGTMSLAMTATAARAAASLAHTSATTTTAASGAAAATAALGTAATATFGVAQVVMLAYASCKLAAGIKRDRQFKQHHRALDALAGSVEPATLKAAKQTVSRLRLYNGHQISFGALTAGGQVCMVLSSGSLLSGVAAPAAIPLLAVGAPLTLGAAIQRVVADKRQERFIGGKASAPAIAESLWRSGAGAFPSPADMSRSGADYTTGSQLSKGRPAPRSNSTPRIEISDSDVSGVDKTGSATSSDAISSRRIPFREFSSRESSRESSYGSSRDSSREFASRDTSSREILYRDASGKLSSLATGRRDLSRTSLQGAIQIAEKQLQSDQHLLAGSKLFSLILHTLDREERKNPAGSSRKDGTPDAASRRLAVAKLVKTGKKSFFSGTTLLKSDRENVRALFASDTFAQPFFHGSVADVRLRVERLLLSQGLAHAAIETPAVHDKAMKKAVRELLRSKQPDIKAALQIPKGQKTLELDGDALESLAHTNEKTERVMAKHMGRVLVNQLKIDAKHLRHESVIKLTDLGQAELATSRQQLLATYFPSQESTYC